jgi:hydroxymethylbilane synthase
MSSTRTIRIASRKSQLALVQTHWVRDELQKAFPDVTFEIASMSTKGDNILDAPLAKIGDKGLFTKELEVQMLEGNADFAVHSLKDLPTNLPTGLMLGCVTEREDPADALVVHASKQAYQLETLPAGSVIGTSSLRRLAQLRHHYPHLAFKDVRGNLNTRLAKLDDGEYDGLILAYAGLHRLGFGDRIHQSIAPEISLHAVGQGALGIECRDGDADTLAVIKALEHTPTAQRCHAERAFLRELEGGCQVPIGVNTAIVGETLTLKGLVASLDGQELIQDQVSGPATAAEALGIQLAGMLKDKGAQVILDHIFATVGRG